MIFFKYKIAFYARKGVKMNGDYLKQKILKKYKIRENKYYHNYLLTIFATY